MVKRILSLPLAVMLPSFALTNMVAAGDEKKSEPSLDQRESEFYRIATLPTPPGVQFESGALQFLAPDTLVCSTRIGDIWFAQGVLGNPPQPKWTLFASGLHEV